jgi:hypothetical protein
MIYTCSGDPVYVDSGGLDGFVDRFVDQGCTNLDCRDCRYCRDYADRVVRMDSGYRSRCIEVAERLLGDLSSGAMWGRAAKPRRGAK